MSTSDHDPFADDPELEHAQTVAMTAIPVHQPDGDGAGGGGRPGDPAAGGGGKLKWIVIAVIAVLLIGGGVTAAVLLTGGDDSDGDDTSTEAEASEAVADETDEATASDETSPTAPETPTGEVAPETPAKVETPEQAPTAAVETPPAEAPEPTGVLTTPATPEELAAAEALGTALTDAGDDYKKRKAIFEDPQNARALVVLAATTDDPVLAGRALEGMKSAYGPAKKTLDADDDYVAVVLRWTDLSGGVDWRTLAPAIAAMREVGIERMGTEPIGARLIELIGYKADPAVQLEALTILNFQILGDTPGMFEAVTAALESPQPAVVSQALGQFRWANGVAPEHKARLTGKAGELLASPDPGVRGRALEVWAKVGEGTPDALAVNDVLPWLTDSHPFVRSVAVDTLATFEVPEVIHVLVPMLADSTRNTYSLEALREHGPRVLHDGGVWSRVDDNVIKAIAASSKSLPTPFACTIEARRAADSMGECRAAARSWYDEHVGDIAPMVVEYEPVSNPPDEPTLTDLPEGLPELERELVVGQRVVAAKPTEGGHVSASVGWVRVPGVRASLVRTAFDEVWVPNALIAAVSLASGDEEVAEPGQLVLTSEPMAHGPMLVVAGGTPQSPMAVDPGRLDGEPRELEPGSFRVVREALEPGTAAVVDDGRRPSFARVFAATDDQVVLVKKTGSVLVVGRDAVTAVPVAPAVEVGDTVQVADTFGRLTKATVKSVDETTGILEVGQQGVDGSTKVAPGRFLVVESP